jgi:hypothetical protein
LAQAALWRNYPEHTDYVALADPDGNRFYVVQTPALWMFAAIISSLRERLSGQRIGGLLGAVDRACELRL